MAARLRLVNVVSLVFLFLQIPIVFSLAQEDSVDVFRGGSYAPTESSEVGVPTEPKASVGIKSSVDKQKITQDEAIIFKVDIVGELKTQPEIKLPDFKKDFEIVSTEQLQSFSVAKGKVSREASFIYVLSAKAAGKFTIGEVEVKIGKESFKTAAIDIEVTPAKNPRPKSPEQKPRIPAEIESDEEQVIL